MAYLAQYSSPSQNFTSQAVIDCLGSALTNKYSEGLPHARYYGGNEYIDMVSSATCVQLQFEHFDLRNRINDSRITMFPPVDRGALPEACSGCL